VNPELLPVLAPLPEPERLPLLEVDPGLAPEPELEVPVLPPLPLPPELGAPPGLPPLLEPFGAPPTEPEPEPPVLPEVDAAAPETGGVPCVGRTAC
jgi:DNA polymerase III subunit gamma/tau